MTEAHLALWNANVGLAKHLALRRARSAARYGATFYRGQTVADDLVQASLLGLWLACLNYQGTGKFSTYAGRYIAAHLSAECWNLGVYGFKAEAYARAAGRSLPLREDLTSAPEPRSGPEFQVLLENRDFLDWVVNSVSPARTRQVAKLYWVEGKPTRDVAAVLGVGVSVVEREHREAMEQMRRAVRVLQDVVE